MTPIEILLQGAAIDLEKRFRYAPLQSTSHIYEAALMVLLAARSGHQAVWLSWPQLRQRALTP